MPPMVLGSQTLAFGSQETLVTAITGTVELATNVVAVIQVHDGFIPIAGEYNAAAGKRFASGADKTRIRSPICWWVEIRTAYNNSDRTGVHSDIEHRVSVGSIGTVETQP